MSATLRTSLRESKFTTMLGISGPRHDIDERPLHFPQDFALATERSDLDHTDPQLPASIDVRLAVLDARVLESSARWSVMHAFRWLITLANVVVNFMLIALALFFAAMLITGPAVA